MKINFKKIATVLGSAVLVGSTLGFAAAASYPAPFNQEASAIVVGSPSVAALSDAVAAANIASNLAAATTTSAATGTTSTATGGDSYQIQKSSTKFNIGDTIANVISGTVTDDNLPTLLADGTFVDDDNDEFDFTQKIELNGATQLVMFEDSAYKADEPVLGFDISSGSNVLNYTLDFTTDPLWTDLATTDLTMMGKNYYVLTAGTATAQALTLLDSADSSVVAEGETKTITVNGTTYNVKINFVGSNQTKLDINGQITNTLNAGETQRIGTGSYVGIKEINYNSKDTGISNVEFSIGAGKLELTEGEEVEINDEDISGLTVDFTSDTTATKLSSLKVIWNAEDDLFVTEDSEITMPGFKAVKMSFGGVTYAKEEVITLDKGGQSYVVLKDFPLKDATRTINYLGYNGTHYNIIGKDSDEVFRTSMNGTLTFDQDTDDYFVVSWNDGSEAESYLMQFSDPTSSNKSTLKLYSGSGFSDYQADMVAGDTKTIGNAEVSVVYVNTSESTVQINAGSNTAFNALYSKEGMKVQLPWANTTAMNMTASCGVSNAGNLTNCCSLVTFLPGQFSQFIVNGTNTVNTTCYQTTYVARFSEEDKNGNIASLHAINVTLSENTDSEVSISTVAQTGAGTSTEIQNTDVFRNFVYSELGTEIKWDMGGDQDMPLTLIYHGEEAYGNVFLNAPNTVVTPGTTPGTGAGSVTVYDSEVSSVQSKNLVVVGGSCVNTVAASLLGSTTPLCGADFTTKTGVGAGQFLLQAFNSPYTTGKVAMLVAGYDAADTSKASTYLTTNTVNTAVGTVVKKTSATFADVA